MDYRVIALGDSVMWGQGLLPDQKFARIVGGHFAHAAGRPLQMDNYARSGATLLPPGSQSFDEPILDIGFIHIVNEQVRHRREFVERYPELFADEAQRKVFMKGEDEAARHLYGEIPADYPSVKGQLWMIDNKLASFVNLVLLNGGANDVDFQKVLNPRSDLTLEQMEQKIRQVMYVNFLELLRSARSKFRNALIVVPGYYTAFSSDSERGALRKMAKEMARIDFLLDAVNALKYVPIPFVSIGALWLSDEADDQVDAAVEASVARSEFAFGRALFWQSRAVAEAWDDPSLRGPGVLYVHPGFRPEHAAFGNTGASYLFEDYKPAKDPAREKRLAEDPRAEHKKLMKKLHRYLGYLGEPEHFPPSSHFAQTATNTLRNGAKQLRSKVTGPTPLITGLDAVSAALKGTFDPVDWDQLREAVPPLHAILSEELARIEVVEMASFLHPSPEGSRQYARAIIAAVEEFRQPNLPQHVHRLAGQLPGVDLSSERVLRSYGLDPKTPPEYLVQSMSVDSLALRVKTVDAVNLRSVRLVTRTGKSWKLETPLEGTEEFGPGVSTLFMLDTYGTLHLSELAGLMLEFDGDLWLFGGTQMFVNSLLVLDREPEVPVRMGNGQRFTLPYAVRAAPQSPP